MKEELLTKFTEKLLTYVNNLEQFASGEIPLYVKELLQYRLITSVVVAVVSLVIVAIVVFIANKAVKSEAVEVNIFGPMTLTMIGVTFAVLAFYRSAEVVKIKYAPRVFIVDYLRGK